MMTFTQRFSILPLPYGKMHMTINPLLQQNIDFIALIQPETPFEAELISLPEFRLGYNWGQPRFGHPEGKVGIHVKEVMENINRYATDMDTRRQLRLIALSHDTFKYQEIKGPNGMEYKHHGLLAREFMEKHTSDEVLLNIIELHDEAFYIWRAAALGKNPGLAKVKLDNLLSRLGNHVGLYFQFFKCDTQTGDKMQAPLYWFEQIMKEGGYII